MQQGRFGFLVIGAGRGGTSLLAALLDNHPRLAVEFELFAVELLMGAAPSRGSTLADRVNSRASAFRHACEAVARRTPDRFWGNKITTEQLFVLEEMPQPRLGNPREPRPALDHLFGEALKGIRVVFILRDGRACVSSKVARTSQPWELACDRWLYSVSVYEYLGLRGRDVLRVRFEELLERPQAVLREVCQFLSIEPHPAMMSGVNSSKVLPEYRYGRIEPTRGIAPPIDPEWADRLRAGLERSGYV